LQGLKLVVDNTFAPMIMSPLKCVHPGFPGSSCVLTAAGCEGSSATML
jgi:hypothetical protein